MVTAVDTSVLLDVFGADAAHGPGSRAALRDCLRAGRLVACDVVWAETAAWFDSPAAAEDAFDRLSVAFDPVDRAGALVAATAWRAYRQDGGPRDRVIADFLVAGHAQTRADRLLTRDRGFYRSRFAGLVVLDPSSA